MLDDQREAVRLRERQGTVEQGVDDGKDGGIGADADRQREDGGGRERRRRDECADRVAKILREVVDRAAPVFVARRLAPLLRSAERDSARADRDRGS